jgi:hypothetical protein
MHEDPVIQQVAGWVSARAGGRASSDNDDSARAFMKALYEFMAANQIAYQTPPSGTFNEQFGQHVKFGRDVLRNRAGTCIDLAILYGSVCEAVGLRPVLTLIPGHCFPAVYLPSGSILAVETTAVGKRSFEDACKIGGEEFVKARRELPAYFVDIEELHNQGVYGLELTSVSSSALADWGIRPNANAPQLAGNRPASAGNRNNDRTALQGTDGLVGSWLLQKNVKGGELRYLLVLTADGRYECNIQAPSKVRAGESTQSEAHGSYELNGDSLVFKADDGSTQTRSVKLEGGALKIHFSEAGETITFKKVD